MWRILSQKCVRCGAAAGALSSSTPAGRGEPAGGAAEASGVRGAQQALHSPVLAPASPLAAAGPSERSHAGPSAAQGPGAEHSLQQRPAAACGAAAEAAAGAAEQAPQPQPAALPGPAGEPAASAAGPANVAAPGAEGSGQEAAPESCTGTGRASLGEAAGGWDADMDLDLSEVAEAEAAQAAPAAAQPEARSEGPERGRSAANSRSAEDAVPLPAAADAPADPVPSSIAAALPAAASLRQPAAGGGAASAAAQEAPAVGRDPQQGSGLAPRPAAHAAQRAGGEAEPGFAQGLGADLGLAPQAVATSNGGVHVVRTPVERVSPVHRDAVDPAAPPPDSVHAVPLSPASAGIGSACLPACTGLQLSAPGTPAAAGTRAVGEAAGAAAPADGSLLAGQARGAGDAARAGAGAGLGGGVPGREGGDLGEASGGRAESGGAESTASTSHREPAALLEADGDSAPRTGAVRLQQSGLWRLLVTEKLEAGGDSALRRGTRMSTAPGGMSVLGVCIGLAIIPHTCAYRCGGRASTGPGGGAPVGGRAVGGAGGTRAAARAQAAGGRRHAGCAAAAHGAPRPGPHKNSLQAAASLTHRWTLIVDTPVKACMSIQQVTAGLSGSELCRTARQARNEELARKAAAVSEEDMDAVRAECEARLGAAERKVYALTKERDALRRGAERLTGVSDLVREKDDIIKQARLWRKPDVGV